MLHLPKFTKPLAFILSVITLSLSLGYFIFAWTEPNTAPPGGNVSTPINVSTDSQGKAGILEVTELKDYNDNTYFIDPSAAVSAKLSGDVQIGTNVTIKGDGSESTGLNAEKLGGKTLAQLSIAGGGGNQDIFGDGSDGDVTISANTLLTRDMYYNNLTIPAGIILTTGGYRVFVKGTLTNNGILGYPGNPGTTPGGGLSSPSNTVGGGGVGGNGGPGGSSGFAAGASGFSISASGAGGAGGQGGHGGLGNFGSGEGPWGNGGTSTLALTPIRHLTTSILYGSTVVLGGAGGGGGGGGGGAQLNAAEPGGGGGGGGGVVLIFATNLINNGVIRANGGDGGAGGNSNGNAGSGGGGGGGGGGFVMLVYNALTPGTINVNGGSGGAAPMGGGTGETPGTAGNPGIIVKYNYMSGGSQWATSGNNIYYNTGDVGIGTATPGAKLDVAGGAIRTNNQLISTVATGTAPLSISSTTAVTNLNADMVDGYHATDLLAAGGGTPIVPGDSTFAIAPNSYVYRDIRPPAGQTWRVKVAAGAETGAGHIVSVKIYKYNGASKTGGLLFGAGSGTTYSTSVFGEYEITNANYLQIEYYASAAGGTAYYSYFGDSR